MSVWTAINLSGLSATDVVEPLDYEGIFAAMLPDLQARDDSFSALAEIEDPDRVFTAGRCPEKKCILSRW